MTQQPGSSALARLLRVTALQSQAKLGLLRRACRGSSGVSIETPLP